jgi:uncharacterized phage protein (TIGR01671 family)
MRDYRFRGRRVDNGEWVKGHYFTTPLTDENSGVAQGFGWCFLSDGTERHCISQNGVVFVVDPSTVGEFIGLPDKNEVDLYEHDIVKVSWLAELGVAELDCESVGVIEYAQARFRIRLVPPFKTGVYCGADCPGTYEEEFLDLYQPQSWDEGYCVERIGNIHEHPNLLGGEQRG